MNERNQCYHFLNYLNNEFRFVITIYRIDKINFIELKKLLQYINNNQRRIFISKINRNLFFNLLRIIITIIIINVNKFIDDNNIVMNLL